ncbi:hypothetical protein Tco_0950867 [Tanacetum coccineum]
MDFEQLMYSQEYYAGQGSGHNNQDNYPSQDYSMGHGLAHSLALVDDDSPVEEISTVKARKPLKRASKAKTNYTKGPPKEWTTKKEIANTIELPVGNNVVPLRSDTIRLVQNKCSFYGLRYEDPNQHLKDFLKLVDSLNLDSENRERMRLHLFQFSLRGQASNWLERLPAGSITTWEDLTTLQIFYDHVDYTTQTGINHAIGGRLRKLRPDEAWATIERLAHTFISDKVSLNYENPDIEQLLGIMERKFDTLIKDTISLMGRSEILFQMIANEMYRPPSEPSCQEEFEHIVMNFILYQEERVKQLEEYMKVIVGDFMRLSLEVTRRLKEKIGGEQRETSLLEFGWRIGLYTEQQLRDRATLSGLSREETVKTNLMLLEFWPNIGDGGFNVGNTKVKSIRDLKKEDEGDDEGNEATGGYAGHEGVGGFADIYRNMSQGDWQVRQQDNRAHWMYDHTIHQFQYLSTRDNLNPHLQTDPFPGYEADYPPVGYQGYMPPGYEYRLGLSQDDS